MALVMDFVLEFSTTVTEKVLLCKIRSAKKAIRPLGLKAQNPDKKTPHASLTSQTVVVDQAVYSAGYLQKYRPFLTTTCILRTGAA